MNYLPFVIYKLDRQRSGRERDNNGRQHKNEVNICTGKQEQFKCTQFPECIMFHKCEN